MYYFVLLKVFWFFVQNFELCFSILLSTLLINALLSRFEAILHYLGEAIPRGQEVVDYIKGIDPKLYTRHGFPLRRMDKVTSNLVEQANSGLLSIREFSH